MKRDVLSMWTVYDRPLDMPDFYVARRFEVGGGRKEPIATDDTIQSTDLDMVRRSLMLRGLTCLSRSENDEARIIETWL